VRAIIKGPEPASLTAHRQTPQSDYDNYAFKDDLRHTLVMEQRSLCSYCMGRIRRAADAMTIEHWRCQSHYPAEQLNYRNLLGGCLGGQGQPDHLQHCDTKKGDRDLQWNPSEPGHHVDTRLKYELDGTIRADDVVFNGQINDVLNLNLQQIKNNRKGVLTALLHWWKAERPAHARIEREIAERTNGVGELAPYSQVAVWWLRQKLAGMAK
jgi:uncharacterized protein (TIGR02646 family)